MTTTSPPRRGHRSVVTMLPELDEVLPDPLLLALFDTGATDIRTMADPKRGGHGHHIVQYRHQDAPRTAEGGTSALALQRAVADSQARLRVHQEDTPDGR